ncbi:MAG: hypothetical protein KJ905_02835 [Nanoarchaeota archaeon]|nr:hypothetical protein [Nanoarchaeota archaeon]MBU1501685.1 hypothetical protein [Nanoarchaeota archaeon]
MRIKFERGKQRKFIDMVLVGVSAPSLRELGRRINLNYQTLKNYYSERRLLSEELFETLCKIADMDKNKISFEEIPNNWGQVKGGKKSRRRLEVKRLK